jgi:hypothetical protein
MVYSVQFNEPSRYSWAVPINRVRRNKVIIIGHSKGGINVISGRGINNTISMSKTRKITAKRKNRSENGARAEPVGSNPHSNGESFSRFLSIILGDKNQIMIRRSEIISLIRVAKKERSMYI